VERDVALVLPPGVTAAQVSDVLRRTVGPLLERLEVFDEYRGPGIPAGHRSVLGTAHSAIPSGRCASGTWMRSWRGGSRSWRVSLAYDGERADAQVLDQLETILRHVADELAGWRGRAVKAEGELKESAGRGGGSAAKPDLRCGAGSRIWSRRTRRCASGSRRRGCACTISCPLDLS